MGRLRNQRRQRAKQRPHCAHKKELTIGQSRQEVKRLWKSRHVKVELYLCPVCECYHVGKNRFNRSNDDNNTY